MTYSRRSLLTGVAAGTIAIVGCLSDGSTNGDDHGMWSQAHGDAQNTGHIDDTAGPIDDAEVAWQSEEGGFLTEPVIVDGTVYAGTNGEDVVALNADSGDEEWSANLRGERTTAAVEGIAVGDGKIYPATAASSVGVTAFTMEEGEEEWTYEGVFTAAPAFQDGLVYAGNESGELVAIDASNGDEEWVYETAAGIKSSVTLHEGTIYVTSADGTLHAVDAGSGDEEWTAAVTSGEYDLLGRAAPAVADGQVFVVLSGALIALDSEDGTELWQKAKEEQYQPYEFHADSSPSVIDGVVYAGEDESFIIGLDAASGEHAWEGQLGSRVTVPNSPAVTDERLYAGSESAQVGAFDRETGDRIWRLELEDGERVRGSPVVAHGRIYVTTISQRGRTGRVYAIEEP